MKFDFKDNKSVSYRGSHSWRDLNEQRSKRIVTIASVLRRIRGYLRYLIVLCLLFGGFWFWDTFFRATNVTEIDSNLSSTNYLSKVLFKTDGVLDQNWLAKVTQLNKRMKLMDVDIHGIKIKLEALDQITKAEVVRIFPDAIKIELFEEQPMCRLNLKTRSGEIESKMVSLNGVVFSAYGYEDSFYNSLPEFIPYNGTIEISEPINGIDRIRLLMDRYTNEVFKEDLKIDQINAKNFPAEVGMPGQVIEIKTKRIPRILLSAYDDFDEQINRLRYLLIRISVMGDPEVLKVDLSLKHSAAVQFKDPQIRAF